MQTTIPSLEMARLGRESLRREGIAVGSLRGTALDDPRLQKPHFHDFFQLALVQGAGSVMHDFRDYAVEGETLFFLSPGQVHSVRADQRLDGVIISFSQSFYDHTAAPPSELLDLPFFFSVEAAPLLPIPAGDEFRIAQAVAEIRDEFNHAAPFAGASIRAWLRILFARAHRLYQVNHSVAEPTAGARLIRQFHLSVERHFREEFTLAEYARELGVTANHLNDVVREEAKQSAGGVVRQRKLLDAKRLLSHSEMSVSEIGYHIGFQDPSYFSRFFRREMGLAPAAFREQIREKYHPKPA